MAKRKTIPMLIAAWPPEPKTPGERFRYSNPTEYTPGTPRPFIPQFNFESGAKYPMPHPVKCCKE